MFENLLLNNTQKQIIGVALTPGIGLEAAIYDRSKNTVLKYGRRKVEYNFSTREIQDYVEFKNALSELMQELGAVPKALAYLVLPNVYFDFIELPASINNTEIKTALTSKAEEFYLFKKEGEPATGWCSVANINDPTQKRFAYTSFQKSVVDSIKDIFNDFDIQLVGIETSYSATIRGLYSVGLLDDVINGHDSWTAMLVNTNSFTLMYFDGNNLLDYKDTPIAIKSFSTEEAYSVIASNASQLLDNFHSSKLYIISQTDDICAEVLKGQMLFDKEIQTIDSNKYSKKPVIEIENADDFKTANSMTLGVIGASNIQADFSLLMNVMSDDPAANLGVYFTTTILGTVIDVTQEFTAKISIALSVILAVLFGLLYLIFNLVGTNFENSISDISGEISNLDNLIAAESTADVKQEVDMNQIIDEVAQVNVKAIKYYDSIASDIPKNIWLTKYYNQSGDKIVVQGIAESIVDIYEYFKNLKIISPESDIRLNELKVVTNDGNDSQILKDLSLNTNNDRLYSFEISNTAINISTNNQDTNNSDQQNNMNNDENVIIRPMNQNVEQLSDQAKPVN